jgi:hypothetical protein
VALLVLMTLALAGPQERISSAPSDAAGRGPLASRTSGTAPETASAPSALATPGRFDTLKLAAELCNELARVNTSPDLTALLARVADALDAKGLVIWAAEAPGASDLRPVLAHGYPREALGRMATVPRSADNAVAAAYRTAALQIVLARPGLSHGAIVAPLLAPEGCIGALTAEIKGGSETSDAVQALASLFAAQLASIVAAGASTPEIDRVPIQQDGKIASA